MRSFPSAVFAFLLLLTTASCGSAPSADEHETLDRGNFTNPTRIDNQWFPLTPGTQYVYEGYSNNDEGERVPRRLISTVTDLTKVIDGVRSVVTWDRDYNGDELVEAELAFYAQDDDDTVWRMGEYPEEYKNGKYLDAPAWLSGIDGAFAGIEMRGDPQAGAPGYSQGWAPGVDFTDRGQVTRTDHNICVQSGCYEDLLVITETSKAEPGAAQLKYYAPGVGNVLVNWKGEDNTQESIELAQVIQLSAEALADARTNALALEKSAYENSKDVYGVSQPEE